ncbi:MAG: hypothetical protein ING08_08175 [Roseomonas sp.]|nr:hypothetical protein [Roseomonas sp.]
MPAAFLYDNVARAATLTSAQATVATMPLANLQDPQPRRRVRLNAASATLDVDLLASVPVDCVALISTTLAAGATIRARLANVADFSTTLADTGTIAAEAEAANQGNVILTLPAPINARYLRIDLVAGSGDFIDVGVLAAGQLWRTTRSIAYGIEEGREILDRRDRNPFTGAEFPVPAIANPRFARFTLPVISDAEVRANHRELVRLLGAVNDGLCIPDIADTLAERNRRAIWGAMNQPGGTAGTILSAFNISERSFTLTERL